MPNRVAPAGNHPSVLCQEGAPDFERIIAERKLLLVSLPARTLGDAADLVGSVIVYRLWQAAQRWCRAICPILAQLRD